MKKLFFMRALLDLLAQGSFFRKLVAVTLRVVAALFVLGSLPSFFRAGKVVFELPASSILGGILFQLFFIAAIYAVVHVLLIRARDAENLPVGGFCALPLGAVLVKLAGEAYASFLCLLAVGGGIFVWFTGKRIEEILTPVPAFFPALGDPSFMGGIAFMLGGVLLAIGVLVVSYVVSEGLTAAIRSGGQAGEHEHQETLRQVNGHSARKSFSIR